MRGTSIAAVEHQGVQDGHGHMSAARGGVTRKAFGFGVQVSLHSVRHASPPVKANVPVPTPHPRRVYTPRRP
jgi:hypothetical protein